MWGGRRHVRGRAAGASRGDPVAHAPSVTSNVRREPSSAPMYRRSRETATLEMAALPAVAPASGHTSNTLVAMVSRVLLQRGAGRGLVHALVARAHAPGRGRTRGVMATMLWDRRLSPATRSAVLLRKCRRRSRGARVHSLRPATHTLRSQAHDGGAYPARPHRRRRPRGLGQEGAGGRCVRATYAPPRRTHSAVARLTSSPPLPPAGLLRLDAHVRKADGEASVSPQS